MVVYRVCGARYAVLDGTGAALRGARWNTRGRPVVYTAEHYATALLEQLVHAGRMVLPPQHAAEIVVPDNLPMEQFDERMHPGWDRPESSVARAFGDEWLARAESACLRVPSVPARPWSWNVLLNPLHPAFARITAGDPLLVRWDQRLFPERMR